MRKTIAITMGDPLGIGPEITRKALEKRPSNSRIHFIVIGPRWHKQKNKNITFYDVPFVKKTEKQAGKTALEALIHAVKLLKSNTAQALVTAPISKKNISLAGFQFPGHTEFLCHHFKTKKFGMMLFNKKLRVVLSTIHVPLLSVPRLLTQNCLLEKLQLTAASLKTNFKIKNPRIAVCGLNPHAGEKGLIGNEENTMIIPAIKKFSHDQKFKDTTIFGPLPADTVFKNAIEGRFDAVLCHYHDQGLIPIKLTGFDHCVNWTLGLPFVRTSPGHGTAFDIAGKNKANPNSMMAAINAAVDFIEET